MYFIFFVLVGSCTRARARERHDKRGRARRSRPRLFTLPATAHAADARSRFANRQQHEVIAVLSQPAHTEQQPARIASGAHTDAAGGHYVHMAKRFGGSYCAEIGRTHRDVDPPMYASCGVAPSMRLPKAVLN
jgi:hypothetical protein